MKANGINLTAGAPMVTAAGLLAGKERRAMLRVGRFGLFRSGPGKVWIQSAAGEGGDFDEVRLARHIERFFNREF